MVQQTKTSISLEDYELPDLKEEHIHFARLIAQGKSKADAYRIAVGRDGIADNTAWTEGSKLAQKPEVIQWITICKRELLSRETYTFEEHIKELDEIKDLAIKSGNLGAASQCAIHKGKATNHYVERKEIEITHKKQIDTFLHTLAEDTVEAPEKPVDEQLH